LPGGWVEQGEDPADTVRREVKEELGWPIEVKALVLCQVQGGNLGHSVPLGLGLVYYCRLQRDIPLPDLSQLHQNHEILALAWVDPAAIQYRLSRLESDGIAAAKRLFDQTQRILP
jgi:8-oxo-dGTP pyrophosphatase MutT (NUDIX family)